MLPAHNIVMFIPVKRGRSYFSFLKIQVLFAGSMQAEEY